jgi:hypothetical protein
MFTATKTEELVSDQPQTRHLSYDEIWSGNVIHRMSYINGEQYSGNGVVSETLGTKCMEFDE